MKRTFALAVALALAAAFASLAGQETHTIRAKGAHGWMRYWGDGSVHMSGKGSLTVKNASNLQIKIDGTWGEMEKIPDGAVYTHFEGSIDALGTGSHLELRGWNLELSGRGRGKAYFQGKGTTVLDGDPELAWPEAATHQKWLKVHFGR